jgi:hypothetical protein
MTALIMISDLLDCANILLLDFANTFILDFANLFKYTNKYKKESWFYLTETIDNQRSSLSPDSEYAVSPTELR